MWISERRAAAFSYWIMVGNENQLVAIQIKLDSLVAYSCSWRPRWFKVVRRRLLCTWECEAGVWKRRQKQVWCSQTADRACGHLVKNWNLWPLNFCSCLLNAVSSPSDISVMWRNIFKVLSFALKQVAAHKMGFETDLIAVNLHFYHLCTPACHCTPA